MRAFALSLVVVATIALPASAATLKAKYFFNNTLASSVAGAPALTLIDPLGVSGYVTDTVFGVSRRVFEFNGTNAIGDQSGLSFDSTSLLTPDSSSVVLTFEFFDRQDEWRRILDVQDRTSDQGFYVDPDNVLNVFPLGGSAAAFTNNTYRNVGLTVGPGGAVNAYIDGGASLSNVTPILNIGASGILTLFADNLTGGFETEWSAGRVATVSFYDGVLTAEEIAAIDANPFVPAPEPAMVALFGFGIVALVKRRHARG